MAPNKIIPIVVAAALCGCEPVSDDPSLIEEGTIVITENATGIVQKRPGYDPLVSLFVLRAPSDSLISNNWEINGEAFDPDSVDIVLGRTWDRDDILPEGVSDMFSIFVPKNGEISVTLIAKYRSGKEYRPTINYTY